MAVIEVADHLDRVWQDAGPTDNRRVAARPPNCSDTLTTVNYRGSLCLSLTIACRAEVSFAVLRVPRLRGTRRLARRRYSITALGGGWHRGLGVALPLLALAPDVIQVGRGYSETSLLLLPLPLPLSLDATIARGRRSTCRPCWATASSLRLEARLSA